MVHDGCTGCCFDCGIEKMGMMMEWGKGERKKGGRKKRGERMTGMLSTLVYNSNLVTKCILCSTVARSLWLLIWV